MRGPQIIVAITVLAVAGTGIWLLSGERSGGPAGDAEVRAACGSCHAFPPPEILPRALWRAQIEHMARLVDYLPSLGAAPFRVEAMVAWYEARAPHAMPMEPHQARENPPLQFLPRRVYLGPTSGPGAATVGPAHGTVHTGGRPSLAIPNMLTGSLHLFSLRGGPHFVGTASHPARITPADLDGDGRDELLVSDLGDPMPSDEPVGRILAARHIGGERFRLETLLQDIGRASDTAALDLDGDGDLDLIAAAFGWLRRGGIYVLRSASGLDFAVERVSDRPGAVRIRPFERLYTGFGRGFAVAFSQHYERISAFRRAGAGWEERVLFEAPHPNWGMSDLESIDLDADSDLDFLIAHGDTLDDGFAFKPYHGVDWLENLGDGRFEAREIGRLYGAHAARAADLDGDGDLDVVACSFLPQVPLPVPKGPTRVDSIVWFERTREGWIPWSLESNHPRHTGLAIVDIDEDGRLDVVTAINRAWDTESVEHGPSLELWLNRGPR